MTDFTQGDPRLIMGPSGASIQFTGGQPLMDQGLENMALISLFSAPNWCGNAFMSEGIGSDFETACNQSITKTSLANIRNAALAALNNSAFGQVTVTVTNPAGSQLSILILLEPPASDPVELALQKNAGTWMMQAQNPAYLKVPQSSEGVSVNSGNSSPSLQVENPGTNDWMQFEDGEIMEF